MRDELFQHQDGRGPQPCAFDPQPVLEGFFLQAEAIEEIASIEADGLLKLLGCRLGGQHLEPGDVEIEIIQLQHDAVAIDQEAPAIGRGHSLPHDRKGLPKVHTCLRLAGVAPQQGGKLFAREGMPRMDRKIGDHGARLAGEGRGHGTASEIEPTQQ
ncbi:hypothetical protein X741_25740 [Mesorhizobium sp. LNHC229A00]|nr:hypothetical protein X741_25740 [Mesorhizobium sp. LNHC229A00]